MRCPFPSYFLPLSSKSSKSPMRTHGAARPALTAREKKRRLERRNKMEVDSDAERFSDVNKVLTRVGPLANEGTLASFSTRRPLTQMHLRSKASPTCSSFAAWPACWSSVLAAWVASCSRSSTDRIRADRRHRHGHHRHLQPESPVPLSQGRRGPAKGHGRRRVRDEAGFGRDGDAHYCPIQDKDESGTGSSR